MAIGEYIYAYMIQMHTCHVRVIIKDKGGRKEAESPGAFSDPKPILNRRARRAVRVEETNS